MGGVGTGAAFRANLEALARLRFNLRTVHEAKSADTSVELFGLTLSLPILGAPMTGSTYNMGAALTERELAESVTGGSALAGSLGMIGDGADPTMYDSGLAAIARLEGRGVAIIKPREQEEIVRRIRRAEDAGAVAVGVDMDGAGLVTMALKGQPVGPKTPRELRHLVESTDLPFIVKGVMTAEEAELCAEAGAAAIVVSNHGGRVLDSTPGAAEVLPRINERVGGRLTVLADGGVRSGGDVLKLLALGARAVLVGRPLAIAATGGGESGVALTLAGYRNELVMAMLLTGTARVSQVGRAILAD